MSDVNFKEAPSSHLSSPSFFPNSCFQFSNDPNFGIRFSVRSLTKLPFDILPFCYSKQKRSVVPESRSSLEAESWKLEARIPRRRVAIKWPRSLSGIINSCKKAFCHLRRMKTKFLLSTHGLGRKPFLC